MPRAITNREATILHNYIQKAQRIAVDSRPLTDPQRLELKRIYRYNIWFMNLAGFLMMVVGAFLEKYQYRILGAVIQAIGILTLVVVNRLRDEFRRIYM